MRRSALWLLTATILVALSASLLVVPQASAFGKVYGDVLKPGQRLRPGSVAVSRSGQYRLRLHARLGLAAVGPDGIVWASMHRVPKGASAIMQKDGNLVVYTKAGRPLWSTGTHGNPGAHLVVQDNGDMVVWHEGRPLWASAATKAGRTFVERNGRLKYSRRLRGDGGLGLLPGHVTGSPALPVERPRQPQLDSRRQGRHAQSVGSLRGRPGSR